MDGSCPHPDPRGIGVLAMARCAPGLGSLEKPGRRSQAGQPLPPPPRGGHCKSGKILPRDEPALPGARGSPAKANGKLKKKNKNPTTKPLKLRGIEKASKDAVAASSGRGGPPRVRGSGCACECVCLCVRGAGRSTHHLAGGARPLRGRIGNVEASLASSATCWLKHQLGQNKKLLKKNLLKITEIERRRRRRLPPPAGPPAPSPAPRPRAQRACVLL